MEEKVGGYRMMSEYDFRPIKGEDVKFKEPKEFSNSLLLRMSYHYKNDNGQESDFVIAKGIPLLDLFKTNHEKMRYISQKMS